jgi:protein TilB
MPHITKALVRKRSEHNEGIIGSLEELTLHQEELEGINDFLGVHCRRLKILYLQNNIIPRMENLKYLRELEYLNLALNNISKIQGLQNCEFLNKLDLTLNFIDFDELEASIKHLQGRDRLRDLFLMGNPSQAKWDGGRFNHYVIAMLPQLERLDGTDITRSMQIQARQKLPTLKKELIDLAEEVRAEKRAKALAKEGIVEYVPDTGEDIEIEEVNPVVEIRDPADTANDMSENTPEAREEIYREMAQQKKEKEDRDKANRPRERDYEKEHAAKKEEVRRKEEELGEREVRQKNEGGWKFRWDEESKRGYIILEVCLNRHLDSSLIDVDVHPSYVSMVVKSKVLRLRLPAEVRASEAKCQRSKTTGSLSIVMPMLNPRENVISLRSEEKRRAKETQNYKTGAAASALGASGTGYIGGDRHEMRTKAKTAQSGSKTGGGRTKFFTKSGPTLAEQMAAAAAADAAGEPQPPAPKSVLSGLVRSTERLEIGRDFTNSETNKVDIAKIVKHPKNKNVNEEIPKLVLEDPIEDSKGSSIATGITMLDEPEIQKEEIQVQPNVVIEVGDDGAFEI